MMNGTNGIDCGHIWVYFPYASFRRILIWMFALARLVSALVEFVNRDVLEAFQNKSNASLKYKPED